MFNGDVRSPGGSTNAALFAENKKTTNACLTCRKQKVRGDKDCTRMFSLLRCARSDVICQMTNRLAYAVGGEGLTVCCIILPDPTRQTKGRLPDSPSLILLCVLID
jgi:hypothetical protein